MKQVQINKKGAELKRVAPYIIIITIFWCVVLFCGVTIQSCSGALVWLIGYMTNQGVSGNLDHRGNRVIDDLSTKHEGICSIFKVI